jgi:hypothetical protein
MHPSAVYEWAQWRRVTRLSSLGNPFECWEPVLPRIPDFLLDSVIYLYSSRQNAQNGVKVGGTGFLVRESASMPGAPPAIYAVTNSHVIKASPQAAPLARRQRRAMPWEARPSHAGPYALWGTCPGSLIRHVCKGLAAARHPRTAESFRAAPLRH